MKRLVIALLSLAGLLALGFGSAKAADSWQITKFSSDIRIEPSGQVTVQEVINADFGGNQLHGIYRTIPISYSTKNNSVLYTSIDIVSVKQDGANATYAVSKDNANETIKIGDANKLLTGLHSYVISYVATGVLSSYTDFDELYWNVTGNGWTVPISNASATITLPQDGITQYSCYQGVPGSTENCQYSTVSKQAATFSASRLLQPGEGLTVAVGYTKGLFPILSVAAPKLFNINPVTFFIEFGTTFIIALILVYLFVKYLCRRVLKETGMQPAGKPAAIMPEYEPPFQLRPGQVGTLLDSRVDTVDVTATIVDLAVHGYLTIVEIPKTWALGKADYLLRASDKPMDGLNNYEQLLLTKLFKGRSEVQLSALRNTFYQDLAEVKDELNANLVASGYFITNPQTVNFLMYGLVVGQFVLAGLCFGIGIYGVAAGLALSALISLTFRRLIHNRSALGEQARQKILGYKMFVSATEKYRQPFFEKENLFMEVLPYAIVFGVTEQLAKAFQEMGLQPSQPSWYVSDRPFVAYAFVNEMSSFSSQITSNMAAAPTSAGSGDGGFSGGGFGGGGGGSW